MTIPSGTNDTIEFEKWTIRGIFFTGSRFSPEDLAHSPAPSSLRGLSLGCCRLAEEPLQVAFLAGLQGARALAIVVFIVELEGLY
jgi:hypothetical protein